MSQVFYRTDRHINLCIFPVQYILYIICCFGAATLICQPIVITELTIKTIVRQTQTDFGPFLQVRARFCCWMFASFLLLFFSLLCFVRHTSCVVLWFLASNHGVRFFFFFYEIIYVRRLEIAYRKYASIAHDSATNVFNGPLRLTDYLLASFEWRAIRIRQEFEGPTWKWRGGDTGCQPHPNERLFFF